LKNYTKEEAEKLLREIMGPPRRELKGEEYKHTWLILKFIDPVESSNNQRTFTDVYEHAGKTYHVTYGVYDLPLIEEVELNT
jgi:hypothetical protein